MKLKQDEINFLNGEIRLLREEEQSLICEMGDLKRKLQYTEKKLDLIDRMLEWNTRYETNLP